MKLPSIAVRHLLLTLFAAFLVVSCAHPAAGQEKSPVTHTKDSLETVKKNLKEGKALLLDVREQDEWDEGHLAQARLLPLSKLEEIKDPQAVVKGNDAKKIIYCHCRAGRRALAAAELLQKLGFEARPLKPGFDELVAGGLEKAPPAKK